MPSSRIVYCLDMVAAREIAFDFINFCLNNSPIQLSSDFVSLHQSYHVFFGQLLLLNVVSYKLPVVLVNIFPDILIWTVNNSDVLVVEIHCVAIIKEDKISVLVRNHRSFSHNCRREVSGFLIIIFVNRNDSGSCWNSDLELIGICNMLGSQEFGAFVLI